MSSLETNKIVGAVLVAGMALLVSNILADKLFAPKAHSTAAIEIPEGETGGTAEPEAPAELEPVSGADLESFCERSGLFHCLTSVP